MKWMHWMVLAAAWAANSAHAVIRFTACPANATAADTVTAGPIYTGVGWTSTTGGTVVAVETTYQHAAWATPANGSWLSPPMADPNTNPPTPATDTTKPFIYTMTDPVVVDSSKIDPASITASGQYGADNYMQGFLVNSAAVGLTTGGGFNPFQNFGPLGSLGMVNGNNTIAFQVQNAEAEQNYSVPMGLWAGVTFTANCKAQVTPPTGAGATPVPATSMPAVLAIVAGLGGLGAWRSRRRVEASTGR